MVDMGQADISITTKPISETPLMVYGRALKLAARHLGYDEVNNVPTETDNELRALARAIMWLTQKHYTQKEQAK